jgi:hypothetical protein
MYFVVNTCASSNVDSGTSTKGTVDEMDEHMEEEEVRLALLQAELNSIQTSIRNHDSTTFQIKGWCVTTSLAVGGFAIAYHNPALLWVGGGAVVGFFMVNCHVKMFQRRFFAGIGKLIQG